LQSTCCEKFLVLNFIENEVEILNVSSHNCIFDKDIFLVLR